MHPTSLTLKPVQAKKLLQSLNGPATAAPEQAATGKKEAAERAARAAAEKAAMEQAMDGKKEAAARAARAAAEKAAVSVEAHTIGEETYDVVEKLNPGGNASIWRVKDARGDKCACLLMLRLCM